MDIIVIGFILLIGGFSLGYLVGALTSRPPTWQEDEKEYTPGLSPRADCMPPGCNDYPECNHRF